jgi:hypothetical protein
MKAIISASNYARGLFPEIEQHWFDLRSEDGKINAKLEIENQLWSSKENPLIKPSELDWEYDIEITITAKPKQEALIIKL